MRFFTAVVLTVKNIGGAGVSDILAKMGGAHFYKNGPSSL